jgi:branched-chain amino acid transport system substrate-binding protein
MSPLGEGPSATEVSTEQKKSENQAQTTDRRDFLKVTGVGTAIAGLAGCLGLGGGSSDTISIGAIFPTTGGLAALGQAEFQGIELRVQELNENGGIAGNELELENKDVATPEAAQSAILEYSDQDVDMIVGTTTSAVGRTASRIANREGLVYTETGAVAQEITSEGLDNVFRTVPSTEVYAQNVLDAVEFMAGEELDTPIEDLTWAHAHEDSVYGSSVDEFLTQHNEDSVGMEKVRTSSYPADTNDLTSVILNMQESDPDILLQTGYVNDTILFWETARQQDYTPPMPFGVGSGTLNDSLKEALGDGIRGIPASGVNGTNTNPDFAPVEEFKSKYEEEYGTLTSWGFGLMTYSGMDIIRMILEGSEGQTDIESYAEAAMSLDEPIGTFPAGYGVQFDENGQNQRALYVTSQWQSDGDGNIETYHMFPEEGQPEGSEVEYIPRPSWSEMSGN